MCASLTGHERKQYRHTLTACNTYCFSTATMVAQARLIVTLCPQFLPCVDLTFFLIILPFWHYNQCRWFSISK